MKKTPFELVGEFHEAMGLPKETLLHQVDPERVRLRLLLILEETREVVDAVAEGADICPNLLMAVYHLKQAWEHVGRAQPFELEMRNLAHVAKELADLEYVTVGAGHEFAFDLDAVFAEVHSSNMSKLGDDGKPIYGPNGKVQKGPNFRPANVEKVLGLECDE